MNESDLILDPEVKSRLEQVLELEIPDPNSLEFQELLEELQENQPELFEEVMRGLTVNVTFPVEQQATKAARRESFYALMTRLFFRRSAVDGEPVAAKRRWLMYTFGILALLGPGLYLLGQLVFNRAPAQETTSEIVEIDPVEPVQPATPLTAQVAPPEPTAEEEAPPPPPVPVQQKKTETPPPPAPKTATPPPPAPKQTAPQAAPAPVQANAPAEVMPTTLSLYNNATPLPTQMSLLNAAETEAALPTSLSLFEEEAAPDTLLLASAETTRSTTLGLPSSGSERPSTLRLGEAQADTSPANLTVGQKETSEGAAAEPEVADTQPGGEASEDGTEGEIAEDMTLLDDILPPGSRIMAKLTTGIAVTQGAVVPVVAKSEADWCTTAPCPEITWLGEASLDASNRVQLRFTQAVFENSVQTISALALGAGDTPGLTASVKDTAPTLAQDLLRSAASGVADYLGVLTEQKTVTVVDGIAVSESETPPLDLFLLGKMGSIFDLPENTTPVVRVAEVPVKTPLVVLYGLSSVGAVPQLQEETSE